jgi:hypothetical protein
MSRSTASASRALSGEELLFLFSRKEPKPQLAEVVTNLADENARLKERQRRRDLHILGAQNGSGKSDLEWINCARLVGAHMALTERGDKYAEAAAKLIEWRPAIKKLLKKNRKADKDRRTNTTDKERIIQLRKNFQSGRATKKMGRAGGLPLCQQSDKQKQARSRPP